jgi:hypothetical protein
VNGTAQQQAIVTELAKSNYAALVILGAAQHNRGC